jgi:hypothetical protein
LYVVSTLPQVSKGTAEQDTNYTNTNQVLKPETVNPIPSIAGKPNEKEDAQLQGASTHMYVYDTWNCPNDNCGVVIDSMDDLTIQGL